MSVTSLVEFLASEIVESPDMLRVNTRRSGSSLYIDITAAGGDVGRLIGRRGRTAEAIRALAGSRVRDRGCAFRSMSIELFRYIPGLAWLSHHRMTLWP